MAIHYALAPFLPSVQETFGAAELGLQFDVNEEEEKQQQQSEDATTTASANNK